MKQTKPDVGVTLRPLEPEDVEFLYSIENDADMWDKGCTNAPYSRYHLTNYILNGTCDIYADKEMRLMMVAEGNSVGLIDLFNFEPKYLRAEVGIAVEKAHRHRGFAIDALRQLVEYARQTLHLHQLYAFVATGNQHSMQLFQTAGFTPTARVKDWIVCRAGYEDAWLMQIFL